VKEEIKLYRITERGSCEELIMDEEAYMQKFIRIYGGTLENYRMKDKKKVVAIVVFKEGQRYLLRATGKDAYLDIEDYW